MLEIKLHEKAIEHLLSVSYKKEDLLSIFYLKNAVNITKKNIFFVGGFETSVLFELDRPIPSGHTYYISKLWNPKFFIITDEIVRYTKLKTGITIDKNIDLSIFDGLKITKANKDFDILY